MFTRRVIKFLPVGSGGNIFPFVLISIIVTPLTDDLALRQTEGAGALSVNLWRLGVEENAAVLEDAFGAPAVFLSGDLAKPLHGAALGSQQV